MSTEDNDISTDPSDYSDLEIPSSVTTKHETANENQMQQPMAYTMSDIINQNHCITPDHPPYPSAQHITIKKENEESPMHVSTSKRNELETLCLDELLQKAMSFKPNLRWNIRNEWCRYCGARASTFSSSPWGPKKLCFIHHNMWKNNELNLKAIAEPINIDSVVDHTQCTEKQYLIDILLKLNDNPGKRRSLRSINVHPKHSYISPIHSDFEEYDDEESFCSSYSMSSEVYESSDKEMNDEDTIKQIKQEHDPSATSNASVMHLYNKLFNGSAAADQLLSHPTSTHVKLKIEPQVAKEDKTKKWRKYYKYKRKTVAKLIICSTCNKQFKSHRAFRDHMLDLHGIERPYKCVRCGDDKDTRYANNAGLIKHIRRDHDKIRDFKCTLCPKSFFDKSVLQSHQRVHDKKKPFRCSYCDKRCTQRSSLRQHILAIHLKAKKHVCRYCNKGFAASTGMKTHMVAVHNDAAYARFECDHCHKKFYEKGSFVKHKHTVHRYLDSVTEYLKNGICFYEGCDKKYTSKHREASLKYHLATKHKDRRFANYECRQCNKLFYDKTRYTDHMKRH